ncbi:methyltransferase domain-containing protein [Mycobacteroides abscessus]|uniref:methyltransferase domain-containing protein n=1 Tax=Mycobacteroides abscessus TaxID=36809 RepID=UPI0009D375FD|nr:methyltransferase domain-containing protein [Mycobacteroides abscessus]SKG08343.1 tRNA (cmo5U34)-methyltransferase [Mycobacteroides abscessus subsp. massiliense]SKG91368.1 tRNA (cmo5U34)-methyltransferase [Mycobacteroides abscessus subsp. massiliense]SKI00422.1 tRNA (cmo5U34)-methyltransferase [Mycobacteroides abscessus subsp. massiliense]SKI96554.1 tRNA (cmo5U34)-methyltransferase [Mycobacteroides abscessus subsp. massiliense]SKJ12522.1 tRNA (cmo5U34)-methyltransferase [Mycobacteroides abs
MNKHDDQITINRHFKEAVDHTVPDGRWMFNGEVAEVFDNMLQRSIPNYHTMRAAVFDLGRRFVSDEPYVVDIGASRGEAIAPFVTQCSGKGKFIAVESASSMAEVLRTRFANDNVDVHEADIRRYCPDGPIDVVLVILTLQFIPIEHRQKVIRKLYERIRPGGAMILVEKILGGDSEINELMVDLYYELKLHNGYTREDIDRKALSLEGVLVPVTSRWNEELLNSAGFSSVECFWRWMNFSGWIAVK